jgi:hypothetical protein
VVAQLAARFDEILDLAESCGDEGVLNAAEAVVDGVATAIGYRDLRWLKRLATQSTTYRDKKLKDELKSLEPEHAARMKRYAARSREFVERPPLESPPIRTQVHEGNHLAALAHEALAIADFRHHDERLAARLVGMFLRGTLSRCPKVWRQLPEESGSHRQRTVRLELHETACDEVERHLCQRVRRDAWSRDETARLVAREYLRAIGLSAKALGNVFR